MGATPNPNVGKLIHTSIFRKLCIRSWWAVAFSILCTAIYYQAAYNRNGALSDLAFRMKEMEKEKSAAIQEQTDLTLRLQSESDPAWIECVLMKELGVVPEGWTKVHFKKTPS